jgi:hypothetical protein
MSMALPNVLGAGWRTNRLLPNIFQVLCAHTNSTPGLVMEADVK